MATIPIDTNTAKAASTIAAIDPSWAFIALALVLILGFLTWNLLKNTKVTEAIAARISDPDAAKAVKETSELIKTIRADQITSNAERKAQAEHIIGIDKRLTVVEQIVRDKLG